MRPRLSRPSRLRRWPPSPRSRSAIQFLHIFGSGLRGGRERRRLPAICPEVLALPGEGGRGRIRYSPVEKRETRGERGGLRERAASNFATAGPLPCTPPATSQRRPTCAHGPSTSPRASGSVRAVKSPAYEHTCTHPPPAYSPCFLDPMFLSRMSEASGWLARSGLLLLPFSSASAASRPCCRRANRACFSSCGVGSRCQGSSVVGVRSRYQGSESGGAAPVRRLPPLGASSRLPPSPYAPHPP